MSLHLHTSILVMGKLSDLKSYIHGKLFLANEEIIEAEEPYFMDSHSLASKQ